LRIATRGSRLALWQATYVRELLLQAAPRRPVELVEVSTSGDRDRSSPLVEMGGQGAFTREVQQALLDHRADVAVHSLKDLPTQPVEGLQLASVPARGPRFDVLVLPTGTSLGVRRLEDLPPGARLGTGSPRRRAQLLHARPDLHLLDVRGNVETRLRRLDEGRCDALVLAAAGLERLALAGRISLVLAPPVMFPAVGQAALGLECRQDDLVTRGLLEAIVDARAWAEVLAERACLAELRAGCHAPVGVLCEGTDDGRLTLSAVVLSADGSQRFEAADEGLASQPVPLGRAVAEKLLSAGAGPLIVPLGSVSPRSDSQWPDRPPAGIPLAEPPTSHAPPADGPPADTPPTDTPPADGPPTDRSTGT
jgi:hydroxymethylbilane synthase